MSFFGNLKCKGSGFIRKGINFMSSCINKKAPHLSLGLAAKQTCYEVPRPFCDELDSLAIH